MKNLFSALFCTALCTIGASAQTDIRIDPLDLTPPVTNGIWVQPAQGTKAQPIWGFADGIQVGIAPMGGLGV